jgi:hypothetical protein
MGLGFDISIYRQQNDGSAPASFGAPRGAELAVWQTFGYGLDWINDLLEQQKAVHIGGGGYPIEYTARAADVVPRLGDKPPDDKTAWPKASWTRKDTEAINACRPEEWLIIVAWDKS